MAGYGATDGPDGPDDAPPPGGKALGAPSSKGGRTPTESSPAVSPTAARPRVAAAPAPRLVNRAPGRGPDRALQDLWVQRLRLGDAEALRDVVDAFAERIAAVVSGILRDRDAVDDVVQETFTKAFYRIASFQGGSSLYTWLYRVAVNGAKDHIKARRRRPAVSFDDLPSRGALPAGEAPLVEGLERRELRLAVRAAIASLPKRFRTVLALRELEGLTYSEIAEVLGLSLGTVESRLFRARRRLKALWAQPSPPSSVAEKGRDT